jgi:hypothetical protein
MRKLLIGLFVGLVLVFNCNTLNAQNKKDIRKKTIKKTDDDTKKTNTDKLKIIREGVGIEGIVVGRSTMDDVVRKFGKDYKLVNHKKYSSQLRYGNLGLSFYYCYADKRKVIFVIETKSPYKGKTSKGIILRESTVEDIEKKYGRSKSGLEYRGINFYYNKIKGKKIVTGIDIVENSGIRQCPDNKKEN